MSLLLRLSHSTSSKEIRYIRNKRTIFAYFKLFIDPETEQTSFNTPTCELSNRHSEDGDNNANCGTNGKSRESFGITLFFFDAIGGSVAF